VLHRDSCIHFIANNVINDENGEFHNVTKFQGLSFYYSSLCMEKNFHIAATNNAFCMERLVKIIS